MRILSQTLPGLSASWLSLLIGCASAAAPETRAPETRAPETRVPAPSATESENTIEPLRPAGQLPSILDGTVRWQIVCEPVEITNDNRDTFRLGVIATNEGDETLDPHLGRGQWTFDGEQNFGLDLSMSNGVRVLEWSALPPGETVTDERGMGAMLTEPGEHSFEYSRAGQTLTVTVVVR